MKISIALTVLILAAAAALGWRDHQRLVTVREHHTRLVAEAATLGLARDPSHPADPIRISKRERGNKEMNAKATAVEFIAFAKEMEAIEKKGGPPDEATHKRMMEIMDHMLSLDSTQLKILITEVRADQSLKDETRQGLIGFSITTLANDHPQTALALFTESADLFKDSNLMSEYVISSSLAKWAKDDPLAALEWVRKNGEKFPDLVTDDAKRGLISGTAVSDPKSAFKLIGELGIKNTGRAISEIIEAAKTAEERTATLAALRGHLVTLTDEKTRNETAAAALKSLAPEVLDHQNFEAACQWIAAAKFSPVELLSFADGIYYSDATGQQGQWIEWVGKTLPAGKSDRTIRDLIYRWTTNDYQAAGKWLSGTPAGPTKNAAIRSYAETVSRYDPATATQWAMTLPPGTDRDETLKNIQENSPAK